MGTIAQLPALKERLHQRNLQKARFGISADPAISIEVAELEAVIGLMERIEIHRRNADHYLKQASQLGQHVPPYIQNGIASERASIDELRRACAKQGYPVESHPVDTAAAPLDAPPIAPSRYAWEVTAGLAPGQPDPTYTRRWVVEKAVLFGQDGQPWALGIASYNEAEAAAQEYARHLMQPQGLNWVRLDWICF